MNNIVSNSKLAVDSVEIPYQVTSVADIMNFTNLKKYVSSKEKRQQLFDSGVEDAKQFLLNLARKEE
jgi:hypothetical protein